MSKARDIADLGAVTSRLDTVGASDGALSNRNLIINGAMQVAQRGTGPVSAAAYQYNTADRMRFSSSLGTLGTWTQEVVTDQDVGDFIGNALKSSCSVAGSGGNEAGLNIRLELDDVEKYVGKKLTLSYYAKSDAAVTLTPAVFADTTITMGTDTFTTSYTRYTHTFTLTSLSTKTFFDLGMRVDGEVATSHFITGVQLEVGDTATPFEHRSYGDELQRCQRYFQTWGSVQTFASGVWFASNQVLAHMPYHKEMRASPTFSTSGSTFAKVYKGGSAIQVSDSSPFDIINTTSARANLSFGTAGTSGHGAMCQTESSAYIHADAEL